MIIAIKELKYSASLRLDVIQLLDVLQVEFHILFYFSFSYRPPRGTEQRMAYFSLWH